MQIKCYPSTIEGKLNAPASKSMTIRALAAGLLSNGTSTLIRTSYCTDALDTLAIIRNLGAEVVSGGDEITILGGFLPRSMRVNCGESGLAMRMFAPIVALHRNEFEFIGKDSLVRRPVAMIGEALRQLGTDFHNSNGFLPFTVKGPLKGGKITIGASISSQLLTGLLMALPLAENDSEIRVSNLKSKPYVDMTLQLLTDFGIHIVHENHEKFSIKGNQQYIARDYTIEGDWSGAAFLLVAGSINGNLSVNGISQNSSQADRAILEALKMAGTNLTIKSDAVEVEKSELHAFSFNASDCPDLFPPLSALAANCNGISTITGIERLIHKESNRALTILQMLTEMGIQASLEDNSLIIKGGKIKGTLVHSHNDHRIAMMAAVLSLKADKPVTIGQAECVAKSYPGFYDDMKRLGMKLEELTN